MGVVFLAEHRRMGRLVALKVLHPEFVGDETAVVRFHREVKAVSRLSHPNVVTAYDADEAGGPVKVHFLVMEYVPGRSLNHHVKARGPLPPAEACQYVRQAALGLQHAHEMGMVHRDIKPGNLVRTESGDVKILDFGLARLALGGDVTRSQALTRPGEMAGTPDYIAPEQVNDTHSVDIRADIYSLGCTLYHLLTGRVPFPGGTLIDKVSRHLSEEAEPLSAVRPGLPEGLEAVVARMMAKDQSQRYPTPAAVADALAPFTAEPTATVAMTSPGVEGLPVKPASPPSTDPVPSTVPAEMLRTEPATAAQARPGLGGVPPWAVVSAAALVAVCAATLAWGPWRVGRPSAPGRTSPSTSAAPEPVRAGPTVSTTPTPGAPGAPEITKPAAEPVAEASASISRVPRVLIGADALALKVWMDGLPADGYRPTFLGVHAAEGDSRFNAIANYTPTARAFRFRMGVDPEAAVEKDEAFHRYIICPYAEAGRTELAVVDLTGRQGPPRFFGPRLGAIRFLDEWSHEGRFRVLNLSHWPGRAPGRFYCQLAPGTGEVWEAKLALNARQVRETFDGLNGRGWRPEFVSAYLSGEEVRFMIAVQENASRRPWDFRTDLSASGFEQVSVENLGKGLSPRAVTSYGPVSEPLYTALWIGPPVPQDVSARSKEKSRPETSAPGKGQAP
jgi:hypothetical protein